MDRRTVTRRPEEIAGEAVGRLSMTPPAGGFEQDHPVRRDSGVHGLGARQKTPSMDRLSERPQKGGELIF